MMHQVILRSSLLQVQHAVKRQNNLHRAFSSTIKSTSTSGVTPNSKIKNSSNAVTLNVNNNNFHASPATSFVVESATAKVGEGTSLSANMANISIGKNTSISPKSIKSARNLSNSKLGITKSSFSNSAGSSSNNDDGGSSGPEFRSVYVHPLSQVVLEYLQDSHHEWIVANGLDQSLTIHRDGSFEVKQTSLSHASISTPTPKYQYTSIDNTKDQRKSDSGPIISTSTSTIAAMQDEEKIKTKPVSQTEGTSNNETCAKDESKSQGDGNDEMPLAASSIDENNNLRVWTCYDEQEKKHWLTVRRGLFRQRFLLQDNLLTAWQANRGISLQERLHIAVDEMIDAINRLDRQQQSTSIGQKQWQQRGQRRFRKR